MGIMIETENDILKRLEVLTPMLPELVSNREVGIVEYDVEGGWCIGHKKHNDGQSAAQIAYMTKGVIFPSHAHDAHEHLIVIEGELLVRYGDNHGPTLQAGEGCHFPPGIEHSIVANQNTKLWGITIPAGEGYP